jgi:hypothetical protein
LHGTERVTDHRWPHPLGAQITQLFYLQEIKKGIKLLYGKQAASFPASELSRRNTKNPENVLSMVSFHFTLGVLRIVSNQLTLEFAIQTALWALTVRNARRNLIFMWKNSRKQEAKGVEIGARFAKSCNSGEKTPNPSVLSS